MSEAGMNLRKWISNDCELMKQWQLEHFDHLNMNDFVNHPHRVLGLLWHPQKDYLSLRLTSLLDFLQKRKNTKRFLLMAAGRIFDPLGFASPFTIRFKILFQEIWQRKTDWDEELLPDIREKFEQWCSEASFLCELQIPRYALQSDSVNCQECEIHTFSDASIKAYGAVSYVRLRTFDKISVHLLASKSRVAPLKVLTLPRLELMGALLAARLAKEISRVLNEKISTTNYFRTDSTIALSWIQGPSNRWKVFVANRVKEIRSLTDKDSWRHCPGKDNPSDLLTRGISADSLINCEKWWKGPSFLQEGNTVPVSNNVLLSDESAYLEELKPTERKTLTVILDNNLLNHILSVSNNFQKNLCIFSYIYRFINNCKRPSNKQIGPLRMCEIQRAEITPCEAGPANGIQLGNKRFVLGDGTWKNRGYSSRVGGCAVIGDKTGKCIDAEVMSSFCKGCDSWKRRKGSPAYKKWKILHVKECLKNHNGSAGMMETVGMVRIFQRSLSHRSVRYTSYIGDGDSKTFSSITASNPYGEDITVSKIECVGHVQKRMGTRLRKLKQMSSKLSDGKSIGGKGRLTDRMIDLITTYYGNAIRQNKTCLSDMRKAVWAVYFHISSSDEEPLNSFCPIGPNSWCKYQNQVVEGSVETFRHSNKLPVAVMDAIKPVFNDLSQPKLLQKCLGGKTQNNNESINSLIWKLCPKTLGCGRKIVDISTNEAIVILMMAIKAD
ncbi:uncharacterized protein TNCV_1655401 [Trichonephila clavipes]|nr:uncharacterized protein TNCV_1655401 [Trichonephila clavipes]